MSFFVTVWHHLYQDFWPLDASRVGPNIVASIVQFAVVGLVMYALWPRFRKAIDRWLHGHLSSHFQDLHAKLDAHHKAHTDAVAELHARLDTKTDGGIKEILDRLDALKPQGDK